MSNLKLPPTLKGKLWRSVTGAINFHAATTSLDWRLLTGDGLEASLASFKGSTGEERTFSPSSGGVAYVDTRITVKDQHIERTVVTNYVTKTVRTDTLSVTSKDITRKTHWKYASGIDIAAEYKPLARKLTITKGGEVLGVFETQGHFTEGKFQTTTKAISGSSRVIKIDPRKTIGEVTTSAPDLGATAAFGIDSPATTTATTPRFEGNTTVTTTVTVGNSRQTTSVTVDEGGTVIESSNSHEVYQPTPSGGGVDSSVTVNTDADGKQTVVTNETSRTDDGGFTTITTVYNSDGSQQTSKYTIDGKGNESQTTTTTNSDGSSNVTTTTRDEDGNTTENSQDYDKDGKPVDNNGGGGGGGYPNPDGSGSGGNGEYPSDDGTDETPRSSFNGPVGGSLSHWLDGIGPFSGGGAGSPSVNLPDKDRGDPALFNSVTLALEDGGEGTGRSGIDLRPFVAPEHADPELNPKAVIGVFAGVSGVGPASSAVIAATKLVSGVR